MKGGFPVRNVWKKYILALSALFALALTGCQGPIDLAGIKRVAVLTPVNRTNCPTLGEEIRRELLHQLSKRVEAEIVDGSAIEAALPPEELAAALVEPGRAAELGARYGVDAFLFGTATYYEQGYRPHLELNLGTGTRPQANARVDLEVQVGFELKLLRAADGRLLVSHHVAESAEKTFSLGLEPPFISLTLSLEPIYPRLREEAIRTAVRRTIKEVARASRR